MLNASPLNTMSMTKQGFSLLGEDAQTRYLASQTFDKQIRAGRRKSMMARLSGRSRRLLHLTTALTEEGRSKQQTRPGVELIPLNEIRGSEDRAADFDQEFYPLVDHVEQRWVNVAIAYQTGKSLPPVELIYHNGSYYVRDGHHRISVARAYGYTSIEAVVTSLN
jgi:hypothetical protein